MASYPTAPIVFPTRTDGTTIFAAHINALQDEIMAIEAALITGPLNLPATTLASLVATGQLTVNGPGVFLGAERQQGYINPAVSAGTLNDWNPTGLAGARIISINASGVVNITGIAAQPNGTLLTLYGGFNPGPTLTLKNASASSAAGNRFACPGSADFVLASGLTITFWYDGATSVWRVFSTGAAPAAAGTSYGVRCINAAGQAGSSGAYVTLTWPTEDFDNGGFHDLVTNPTRLTVPAGADGTYVMTCKVGPQANANVRLRFMKNGAVASTATVIASSAIAQVAPSDSTIMQLVAGDFIEAQCFVSAAITIGAAGRDQANEIAMYRIGG